MKKFPEFIIVGTMKTGTTAMWHNLNKHPQIKMCKNPDDPKKTSTEIRFWNSRKPYFNFKKGIDWYKKLFDIDDNNILCGEKDAEMIESKKAMKKLSEYSPDTKIILSVREPAQRAYSEYQMNTRMKKQNVNFSNIFNNKKKYWKKGRYFNLIQNNILPFFPMNNLFITIFEWMKKDTNKELNRFYKFLNISELHLDVIKQKFSKRDSKIKQYKNWDSSYKNIREKDFIYIKNKYKKENEKLFKFLGYRIKEWE